MIQKDLTRQQVNVQVTPFVSGHNRHGHFFLSIHFEYQSSFKKHKSVLHNNYYKH